MVISGPQKQKATFGVRVAGFVTLFDWLVVRQQSCVPGILCSNWSYHLPPGWGLQFCRRTQKQCYAYFLSRNQDPVWRLYQPLIVFFCFCIPCLPCLAIVWNHPLEFREGQGCWMKPISYRQEMENTEQTCIPESHGACTVLTHGTGQLWLW